MLNKRKTGTDYETLAAEYLEANGMRIVERNFRGKFGEIDIIGYHNGYLVFTEVKFRSNMTKGYGAEAVDIQKQYRICRVADYYRFRHGIGDNIFMRYDVVAIQKDRVEWIQNAFPHRF